MDIIIQPFNHIHLCHITHPAEKLGGKKNRTRGHCQKLFKKIFRLDLRQQFFSQRVVDEWNSLSEEIVTSETVNQCKARLNTFGKKNQQSLNQTAIYTRLRMLNITSLMKDDRNGPKSRENIPGLGYSKKYSKKVRQGSCCTVFIPTRII